jgi:hypothetical protein
VVAVAPRQPPITGAIIYGIGGYEVARLKRGKREIEQVFVRRVTDAVAQGGGTFYAHYEHAPFTVITKRNHHGGYHAPGDPLGYRTKANPFRSVPAPFDQFTARDWQTVRSTAKRLRDEQSYDEIDGDPPEEHVVLSVGYAVVTLNDRGRGEVQWRGRFLDADGWPRATRSTKRNRPRRTTRKTTRRR